MPYANNKHADQPAHPRGLISAFVVRCLDSIIPLISISKISSLYLVFVTAQTGLSLLWSQIPKTGFLMTWLKSHSLLKTLNTKDGIKYRTAQVESQEIQIKWLKKTRAGMSTRVSDVSANRALVQRDWLVLHKWPAHLLKPLLYAHIATEIMTDRQTGTAYFHSIYIF